MSAQTVVGPASPRSSSAGKCELNSVQFKTKKLGKLMLAYRGFVTETGKLTTEEVKVGTEDVRPAEDKISEVRSAA
jgi:hypothetical protein